MNTRRAEAGEMEVEDSRLWEELGTNELRSGLGYQRLERQGLGVGG